MLSSKVLNFKSLLESADGVHLTAYLVNRGNVDDLKTQLHDVINECNEYLYPVMPAENVKKFLEPLRYLHADNKIFKQIKGNIGIFRKSNLFRILNVPIKVEKTCQVASSFHVKPLLKWLQSDQDFLFLGIEEKFIHLYMGNQNSFMLIETVVLPDFFDEKQTYTWANEWLPKIAIGTITKIFIAGERPAVDIFSRSLKSLNSSTTIISDSFTKDNANEICASIRRILKSESRKRFQKTLREFHFAEGGNKTKKNIFQISKAIVQGKVRKLVVTDELSVFGKIDRKSGGLALHPFDLDHEDDDILDDFAQMVLSQGGEVIIASRNEIPKGLPILAILDEEGQDLENRKFKPKIERPQRDSNEKAQCTF